MSAPVTSLRTAAETELSRLFASTSLPGAQAPRQQAFARVEASGLPHRRIEAWHYTDLRSMMRSAAPLAPAPSLDHCPCPWSIISDEAVFHFVDGHLVGTPPLPKGITFTSLGDDSERIANSLNRGVDLGGDIVTSLNTAFMADGLLIEVAAGAEVTRPLTLAFDTTGATASFGRGRRHGRRRRIGIAAGDASRGGG